jgi:hypothetical protein
MQALVIVVIALVGAGGPTEYSRALDSKALDQATLDAEGYGEKTAFKREADGLRIVLGPGEKETGWKTPQQVRFGGNFTISATFLIKKLPKPAQEDGAAFGLAIAFQDPNQPDVTLVREIEPKGPEVYRAIEKAAGNAGQMPMQMMRGRMMPMMMGQPQGDQAKPPRRTFPAAGDTVRMELVREGNTIRYQVVDATTSRPRYLGQVDLGPNDVAAIKVFAANRNGAEAINVLMRELSVRADRVNGLGTVVRTVYDRVVYSDPSAVEDGVLTLGGQPKPAAIKLEPGTLPSNVFVSAITPAAGAAPGAATQPANAAAPAVAAAAPAAVAAAPAAAVAAPAVVVMAGPGGMVAARVVVAPGAPGAVMAGPDAAPQPAAEPGAAPAAAPAAKPIVKIPLDELDSIRFERTPALSARYVGQPNLDFTGPGLSAKKIEPPNAGATKDAAAKPEPAKAEAKKPAPAKAEVKKADEKKGAPAKAEVKKPDAKKNAAPKAEEKKAEGGSDDALAPPPGTTIDKFPKVEPKKNGIRDLCISLFGLRNAKIKQVTVNGQTSSGPANWRLDTTDSQDSPLVVRRAGNDMAADLFLDPPAGDCFQKPFQINVIYEDGQNANATATVDAHTKADLAVDSKTPEFARSDAWLYLTGDEKLFGKLEGIGRDSLKLTTPWQDHIDVPLNRIVGVHLGVLDRKESPESFAQRLKSPAPEDQLLAQTKTGEVIAIAGIIEGTEDDKLHFRYGDRTRTLSLKQVEGLIMAARPEPKRTDELRPTFLMAGGLVISGRWKDLDSSVWSIETAWGQLLKLPAAEILDVRFGGGKFVYLSDLSPSKAEETPFFGHRLKWRRNVNLLGEPLRMNGRTYERGIAVHSRSILTYELSGRYSTFETSVGFDDATKGKGRVECRVFADAKELYANLDLKASGQPVDLKLPVAGAHQLRLMVDFGMEQDTGDRVIWANARLHRAAPSGAGAGKTASREVASPRSTAAISPDLR